MRLYTRNVKQHFIRRDIVNCFCARELMRRIAIFHECSRTLNDILVLDFFFPSFMGSSLHRFERERKGRPSRDALNDV